MYLDRFVKKSANHGNSELSRIDYLDGWRGMAIALVLVSHFLSVDWIDLGRMGVDIFFVLSGMLMAKILFIKKVPLRIFYKRRFSRIFPVFFIFVSAASIASFLFGLSNEHENYIYNLLFVRSYFPVEPDLWNTGIPIGHLWSLNVEEHCYILLTLITLLPFFKGREHIPLIALGFISILLQYIYVKFPTFAPENYHLRTEIVASFLLLSSGYSLIKNKFEKLIPSWLPLLALAIALTCYSDATTPHWTAKWSVSPILLAFSVNHLDITPAFFKKTLNHPLLRLLGIWSFSIYLWQQPLYFYGVKFEEAFAFAGPVLLSISIMIGAASFYYFENPARRYLNNNW